MNDQHIINFKFATESELSSNEDGYDNYQDGEEEVDILIAEDILSTEQITQCGEIFDDLKNVDNGQLSCDMIGLALRKLGFTPTEKEVDGYCKREDPFKTGFISKDQLLSSAAAQSQVPPLSTEQMMTSLQYMQEKNPSEMIESEELFIALISMGEPLSIKEAGRFIATVDPQRRGQFSAEVAIQRLQGERTGSTRGREKRTDQNKAKKKKNASAKRKN